MYGATKIDNVYRFKYNPCVGSRFGAGSDIKTLDLFKYNPCVGSSEFFLHLWVEVIIFKYNPCVGSRRGAGMDEILRVKFKYNPCVGSSRPSFILSAARLHLNTTLVSVRVTSLSIK